MVTGFELEFTSLPLTIIYYDIIFGLSGVLFGISCAT